MNLKHGGNVFAVARANGWRWEDIADFSASINPLGPSPAVAGAIQQAMSRIVHYPEVEPLELRCELASRWGIPAECLMLGNGATELLYFLARTLRPARVSLAAPVFSEFHRAFPQADVVGFEASAWPEDGLLVVSRPANPTGQLPILDDYLRSTTNPVLVDESFIEFTGSASLVAAVEQRPNLFVLRSLTKFYALPGLRIGASFASRPTMEEWRARREPWQVNVLAEAAARSAIGDDVHGRATLEFVRTEREWLQAELSTLRGVRPQPSVANYLLIAVDDPVDRLLDHLLSAKILVRDCSGWPGVGFEHAIRISVRTRAENLRLLEAWREFRCA